MFLYALVDLTIAVIPCLFSRTSLILAVIATTFKDVSEWQWITSSSWPSLLIIILTSISILAVLGLNNSGKLLALQDETLNGDGPRPMLFPYRTTHTRLIPKKHTFSYSYLVAGIPVSWNGSEGELLAAGQTSERGDRGYGWFSVDADDYLTRDNGHLGLNGKLRAFLKRQGVNERLYPYVYLMTAPRFLGYSFNPVSFWYLYSEEQELTAMMLEVNNTFDERRVYFLKEDCETPDQLPPRQAKRFSNTWMKDFHVSPFNSREGSYSLVAEDVLVPAMTGKAGPNITIALKSTENQSKLIARLVAAGKPIDPLKISNRQKFQFLLSWWWVGLVTFPRILREAGKLFFLRKLHVWYRPEPLQDSIGRRATEQEAALEVFFRKYLQYLTNEALCPLAVKYIPSGTRSGPSEFTSPGVCDHDATIPTLEIKVLTPLFYPRFMHYAHDSEALFNEFSQNGTIHLTNGHLLPKLVVRRPAPAQSVSDLYVYTCMAAIRRLRRTPVRIVPPEKSVEQPQNQRKWEGDLRTFRLSGLDGFVLDSSSLGDQRAYATLVLKAFLSDRMTFGSIQTLELVLFLARYGLSVMTISSLFRCLFLKMKS